MSATKPANTPDKQRIWISRAELERVKTILRDHLGAAESVRIPFESILPVLTKRDVFRLIWCRTARQEFDRWGIKLGIRNRRQEYVVSVVDLGKWNAVNAGQTQPSETAPEPIVESIPPAQGELDHLIPQLDSHYVMPDYAEHLRMIVESGSKTLLSGPAGSGKTSIVRQLAALDHKPFLRINLNGETSVSDLLGSWKVQGREMVFRYGPVATAVKHGAWLCLDELDAALPAVLFALQGILEEGGSLHIPDTNEWIEPHEEFRLVATANTVGKGDDSGLYAGTQQLNEAFLDRFHCVFHADYLPPHLERQIIAGKVAGLNSRVLDRMLQVANELRKALADGLVYSSFSTRKLLAWASKSIQLKSPQLGATYTVLNKLSADDQRVVAEVLQRHGFGA